MAFKAQEDRKSKVKTTGDKNARRSLFTYYYSPKNIKKSGLPKGTRKSVANFLD